MNELPARMWTAEMFPPPPSPADKFGSNLYRYIFLSQREDKCIIALNFNSKFK